MRFSSDKKRQKDAKKAFKNIYKKLGNIESEIASEYLSWLDKKTSYFKDSVNKTGYNTQPDNLGRGDIVWVEFGINVGTELSDYNTRGHYALVWAVDLGNIVVIPLSSRDAIGSNLTFDIGIIPELNDEDKEQHSYLKLDAIRSISKRRIARMTGRENGKISLSKENIKLVEKAIEVAFLNPKE
ncbi:MAG: type II toxin-antitoxin system PemK/MazF family toxin [Erysipelotrichales bacterium]|nr:type II toxin-antitoxin system PemK/MazF family toxin [Erysipelotrichales bacterium]